MSIELSQVFADDAIREFGSILRISLRENNDYASLIELEYVESVATLAEAIKKLLRRYDSFAHRHGWLWRPSTQSYERLMALASGSDLPAEQKTNSVRLVRAALISHALTYSPVQIKSQKEEKNGGQ
jgi:hypothetical protein